MKFSTRRNNRKFCFSSPIFTVLMLISIMDVRGVSAQDWPNVGWMHADQGKLSVARDKDPSMKAFVDKRSKAAKKRSAGASVHVVYLVPTDKTWRPDYSAALKNAIREMQAFYQAELGITRSKGRKATGETFDISKPTVEIITTSHDSAYYNGNNQAGPFEFFFRAVADGFQATGGGFDDPDAIWVYYIDADPACGQVTGATNGVALLPANDLRGLVGEPNEPPCIGDPPDTSGVCRWIGGLGHELGHAFGLPHPPGCEQGNCPAEALSSLMFLGYTVYPETYFLDEDKERLEVSPFFEERKIQRRTNCQGDPLN